MLFLASISVLSAHTHGLLHTSLPSVCFPLNLSCAFLVPASIACHFLDSSHRDFYTRGLGIGPDMISPGNACAQCLLQSGFRHSML
jgi:urea transporter